MSHFGAISSVNAIISKIFTQPKGDLVSWGRHFDAKFSLML
jgi:hypothetical protein